MTRTPDHATKYAERVQSGSIVACDAIRIVTARHLDEIGSNGLPYWWDAEKADNFLKFFRRLIIPAGPDMGTKLRLFDWECFGLGSLMGWRRYHPDYKGLEIRRYQEVLLQTARGSGKSPLLAGLMFYMLLEDNEPQPQVHLIASKAAQAEITWGFFRQMVDEAEDGSNLFTHYLDNGKLRKRAEPVGLDLKGGQAVRGEKYVYVTGAELGGMGMLVSADASGRGATGLNSSCIIIDEYHDFAKDHLKQRFESGRKQRRQPLTFIATNAGDSDQTPYGLYFQRAKRILTGKLPDDPYFLPLIYEVDTTDKPFDPKKGPPCWAKANPSLKYGYPGRQGIMRELARARRGPIEHADVSRFQFCDWTRTATPWLQQEVIDKALMPSLSPVELRQRYDCFVAVDLGVNRSLSAVCFLWDMKGHMEAEITCWGNVGHLQPKSEYLNIPFMEWFKEGALIECPGDVEVSVVADWLLPRIKAHRVRGLTMDTFKKPQMLKLLDSDDDLRVMPGKEPPLYHKGLLYVWNHPQGNTENKANYDRKIGLWMTASIAAAEDALRAGHVHVLETKPVKYGLEIASVERQNKLAKMTKENDDLPNDAAVVLVEAVGLLDFMRVNERRGSVVSALQDMYANITAQRATA